MGGKPEANKDKSERVRAGSVSLPLYPWTDSRTGRVYWRWGWKDVDGRWRYGTRADKEVAREAARARARMIGNGKMDFESLTAAQADLVRQFVDLNPTSDDLRKLREWRAMASTPLPVVVARWHASKVAELEGGKETPHLRNVRQWLEKLAKTFDGRPAASLTVDELRGYIEGCTRVSKSRGDLRMRVVALWKFAETHGLFSSSEADKLPSYKAATREEVSKWTIDEMKALLGAVPDEFLPWFLLATFSGLRSEEISAKPGTKPLLDWSAVKLEQKVIILPATISKVRKRRLVPITPTLKAWLEAIKPPKSGPVCARYPAVHITKELGKMVGGWRKNDCRHSYGSYRAAEKKDLPALAIEMGTSYPMIEKHYREAVSEKEAKAYWRIFPSDVDRTQTISLSKSTT